MVQTNNVLAMILAGGQGKRMDIFCHQRPKPALPFAGDYRVIDFTLSNCVHSDIGNIAVLVDYQRAAMADYLKQWNSANGESCRLSILDPGTTSFAGTADAVYRNLDYLKKQAGDKVLILAGDHIYKMDYRKMVAFHEESGADVTVGVVQVPVDQAHRFGTVLLEDDGRICQFEEKSANSCSNLASMGIYVFNQDYLARRLIEDARDSGSVHDFGYSILPRIVNGDRVFGYEFRGYWQDIGTVDAYYEASMQLLNEDSGLKFDESWPILTNNSGPSKYSLIGNGKVVNSLIGQGCIIEGYVKNSIVSPGVHVGEKAEIIDSVVMNNTVIGFHSIVDRCILDEEVNIGKFCFVGFGNVAKPGLCDVTMVGKNVNVAAQTAIGRKAKIHPGLRLADLGRFVAPGAVVTLQA